MKKKIKVIIISILSIIVIGLLVFGSITIINKANKERKEEEKKEKVIVDNFDKFKEAIENFNIEWSTYNSVIKNDISEATSYQYDGWIISLDSYTKAIDEVEKVSGIYKKNCINQYYAKIDVKNKCDAWIDAYEKAVNSYVEDLETFNENIKNINKKLKTELKEYELKYKLVDINKDKTFDKIEIQKDNIE